jgi:N-acyl-L-homoserine lactone synthetase
VQESALQRIPENTHGGLGETGPLESGDPILVREAPFRVELLRAAAEKEQAFRLRHRLFAEALHWVPEVPSGLEVDGYDAFTEMIGILDGQRRVLGQVRMHESGVPYMIEREFATVLGSGLLPFKGRDTAEITRFGVAAEARLLRAKSRHGDYDLATLLLKGVYRWSLARNVRTVFAVVDHRVFRLLTLRGFPFETMAEPKRMPDGVVALAIRLDWNRFEAQSRELRPELLAWFSEGSNLTRGKESPFRAPRAVPVSRPWPPLGDGSPHPAFAQYS